MVPVQQHEIQEPMISKVVYA